VAEVEQYDAIVIGAGQAGGPLASALARGGRKTAIVEQAHVGGTCINEGCTPTKTIIASARDAYMARRGADYGVRTGAISVDMTVVRNRKRDIVDSFRGGSERQLKETSGLDILFGHAGFDGPKSLEVQLRDGGARHITAETIVVNVGEHPADPPIEGADSVPILNSTTVMELDVVPEHLLVLGGGYVAVEFGQAFRRFGSRVTIVQRGKQLLAREDADVAEEVAKILRQDGIDIRLETSATRVQPGADGGIALTVRGPEGERVLSGSHLLAAAGRAPNTDRLNAAAAGIETNERGYITVNERLETNVPGIYAAGDCNGGPAFTHISYDDYRILKTNLVDGGHATTTGRLVPYTVFMDPQLGRIGLGEDEAKRQGRKVRVARIPMDYVARALEVDEPRGLMKAIVDGESDRILGAVVLGLEGGELMAMLEIAMMGDLPYTRLRDGIFAHPTLAESLNTLFGSLSD